MAGNVFDDTLDEIVDQEPDPQQAGADRAPADPFDSALDDVIEHSTRARTAKITVAGDKAEEVDPARAADIYTLARRYGLPSEHVARNFDNIQRRAKRDDTPYARMLKETPALADYVSDPIQAAAVKEDMDPLAALETTVRVAGNSIRALAAGLHDFNVGFWGVGEQVGEVTGIDALTKFSRYARQENIMTGNIARGSQEGAGELEKAFYSGFESLGMMAPGTVASIATGGSAAPMLAIMGGITEGEAYGRARDAGKSVGRSTVFGMTQGAVEVATEMIPAKFFLADLAKNSGFLKMVMHQIVSEVPGEQVATMLQDLDEWATLNPDKPFSTYLESRPAAAMNTLVATITSIGAMTTVASMGSRMAGDTGKAERAEGGKQFFDAIAQSVTAMKSAEKHPQSIETVIAQATAGGPIEKLYAPVDTFTTYWQSVGEDPAAKAAELTGDPKAYARALQTGEDLAIPTGTYASKIAATEHNAFFVNELKVGPDDWNIREATQYKEQQVAKTKAVAEAATAAEETPASRIVSQLRQGLEQAGVEKETATQYADLVSSAFGNMAEIAADPAAIFGKMGLSVERPELGPPAPTAPPAAAPATTQAARTVVTSAGEQTAPVETQLTQADAEALPASVVETLQREGFIVDRRAADRREAVGQVDQERRQEEDRRAEATGAFDAEAQRRMMLATVRDPNAVAGGRALMKRLGEINANRVSDEGLVDNKGEPAQTIQILDEATDVNASGESAASAEALSRQAGMKTRGEQFVVYDRSGNARPLIGPDAVDYVAKTGETYGVQGPEGFRTLDDKGGKVPNASTGSKTNRISDQIGSPTANRITASDPGDGKKASERAAKHLAKVFDSILDSARQLDPSVDETRLRQEFDYRVDLYLDQQQLAAESGQEPHAILRAIAKLGGISLGEKAERASEIRAMFGGKLPSFGAVAGVKGVFRKPTVNRTGNQRSGGVGIDDMLTSIQNEPGFEWIESIDMLLDQIDEAMRHGTDRIETGVLPGTEELRDAGIRREQAWWSDAWAAADMVEDVDDDAIEINAGDTSFDIREFSQSLFDEFEALQEPGEKDTIADTIAESPRIKKGQTVLINGEPNEVLRITKSFVDVMPPDLAEKGRALGYEKPGHAYGYTSYARREFVEMWNNGKVVPVVEEQAQAAEPEAAPATDESDQERSRREYQENADRVAADPNAASEKDLRRAAGFLDETRRSYIRKAQRGEMEMPTALLDSIDAEIANYDRLANAKRDAAGDVLDTGEVQPRLPVAGEVRNQERSAGEFELPFSLTAPVAKPPKKGAGQRTLFQSEGVTVQSVRSWADQTQALAGQDVKAFTVNLTQAGDLSLDSLIVARGAQRAGLGSTMMKELTRFADANGLRVVLSPGQRDPVHGTTSRARLVKFYKQFGFVENKGRHKDFSISAGMFREPSVPAINKAPAQTDTPAFKAWFGESKVVDAEGDPLRVYHGTMRADRVGDKFLKSRATSGPSAFFTDSAEIAGKYATGKQDTSFDAPASYAEWFKVKLPGQRTPVTIDRAWFFLSAEQKATIAAKLPHVTNQDTEGNSIKGFRLGSPLTDDYGLAGRDHWEWTIKEHRGNVLSAAVDVWLDSGGLFDEEEQFFKVLKLGGAEDLDVQMDHPHAERSAVIPVFLSIQNPLDTSNISDDVMAAIEQASKGRRSTREHGADLWDKKTRDPRDWVKVLAADRAAGNNSYAWSSIPDWVTETLKGLGFDGIKDTGGKMGGEGHDVWIPFEPTQIKSATGNRGTFDPNKQSILFQSVFHGSPHQFDKFDLQKIGTGEGAQSYGWGLYFAGKREVAEFYRDALSNQHTTDAQRVARQAIDQTETREAAIEKLEQLRRNIAKVERLAREANAMSERPGVDYEQYNKAVDAANDAQVEAVGSHMRIDQMLELSNDARDAIEHIRQKTETAGRLYKVNIPESEDMLDWDRPASEQSPKVQAALTQLGIEWTPIKVKTPRQMAAWFRTLTAQRLWAEDIGIRESLREAKGYLDKALDGDREAADSLMFWQQQHQGYFSKGMIDPTGAVIYGELANKAIIDANRANRGPDGRPPTEMLPYKKGAELASKQLLAAGVPGLRYLDATSRNAGQGTHNFVVFDDELVNIEEFFQKTQGGADRRGSIRFGPDRQFLISLLEKADLSTFLHETGHLFLEVFGDLSDQLRTLNPANLTPKQQKALADYDALLKWLKVENREQIGDEQHEKFARGFEAYLMEGKAPSAELRVAFGRFRSWLVGIYRSFKGLRVDLNDDVRRIMDRMVASEEAIAAAEAEAGVFPMFTTAEAAGMEPAEFALYQKEVAAASVTARENLETRMLAEVAREQKAAWKARRSQINDEVRVETYDMPVYQATSAMQFGTKPNGGTLVEGEMPVPLKLSRQMIVDRFGADRLKQLPKPYIYTKEGGLDPEVVAGMFGYSSGDELLKIVASAEPMNRRIERETDRRMLEEHGSMLLDGTLQDRATAAIANEHREAIIRAELGALARLRRKVSPFVRQATKAVAAEKQTQIDALTGQVRELKATARGGPARINAAIPPASVVHEAAKIAIAGMKVNEVRPIVYWRAALRASQKATEAAARQDLDTAIAEKQHEIMSLAVYREATRALDDIEKRIQDARDLGKPKAQAKLGKAGDSYLDQVNAILDRYDFARQTGKVLDRRESLRMWVDAMKAQDIPVDISDDVIDDARRVHYSQLTVDELVGITDALKHIAHLSTLKDKLLKNQDQRDFSIVRDNLVDSIRENNKVNPIPIAFRQPENKKRKVKEAFASHARIATLAQLMDGKDDGGAMWSAIIRPAHEAATAKETRQAAEAKAFHEILEKHYPGREMNRLHEKVHIPAIGNSLTLDERIAVARNWGNETSRDRMLTDPRRAWNREQIQAILDTLDANDLAFVQATFDFINRFWPEIAAKQKRVTGLEPEKVEALEIVAKAGTIAGGYFPLVADSRYNARTRQWEKLAEADLKRTGAYVSSTTKRGHVQARVKHAKYTVKLEGGVVFSHIEQVIHDLTHHEMLLDVTRLLRDPKVSDAFYDTVGDVVYDQFTSAMETIAAGRLEGPRNFVDEAAQFMKHRTQVALLGYNLWTALQQPLGVLNGADRVGARWVAKGMFTWLTSPARFENTLAWIHDVSPYMATRSGNATQDLSDLKRVFSEPGGWFDNLIRTVTADKITQANILNSMLWHIGIMQRVADVPTWLGQYEKSRAAGEPEARAYALADQAVIDSQGSGRLMDLSKVQRGGPVAQLYMTFYSYGATTFNATYRRAGRTDFKSPKQIAQFLGGVSLIFVFPAFGTVLLNRIFRGAGDDDDDLADYLTEVGRESLASALNGIVLARELTGAFAKETRGYAGPAGARLLQMMNGAITQAKQGELDDAAIKAFLDVGGVLAGLPTAQVRRTIDGWQSIQEDGAPFSSLFFGPPKK